MTLNTEEFETSELREKRADLIGFLWPKLCVDIYLSVHVSQLSQQPESIRDAWTKGREIYQKTCECCREKIREKISEQNQSAKGSC